MSSDRPGPDEYRHPDDGFSCAHEYVLPHLEGVIDRWIPEPSGVRVLDLGCGNGAVSGRLSERGFRVVGVDPSREGIRRARETHPEIEFHRASAYDPLRERLGRFGLVVSLEVVEHVYDPGAYARTLHDVLAPGGIAVVSTPYHGFLKNLAIALLGRFDDHVEPRRVHGHIKFWSRDTLRSLLEAANLEVLEFRRAGRIPPLARSMIAVARRRRADAVAPGAASA